MILVRDCRPSFVFHAQRKGQYGSAINSVAEDCKVVHDAIVGPTSLFPEQIMAAVSSGPLRNCQGTATPHPQFPPTLEIPPVDLMISTATSPRVRRQARLERMQGRVAHRGKGWQALTYLPWAYAWWKLPSQHFQQAGRHQHHYHWLRHRRWRRWPRQDKREYRTYQHRRQA